MEEKVIEVIDQIRPFLNNDGGDIEFVKCENNIVYLRLGGSCVDCDMFDLTFREVVETAIKDAVPEVKEVVNLSHGF